MEKVTKIKARQAFTMGMALLMVVAIMSVATSKPQDGPSSFPENATFTTLVKTPMRIEGLTADNSGNLYTAGLNPGNGVACDVYRVNLTNNLADPMSPPEMVGKIPAPSGTTQCFTLGLAFDEAGFLYVAEANAGIVYQLTPNATTPPMAEPFGTGMPGANGIAFDKEGNLWVSDGFGGVIDPNNAQGRIWKVPGGGGAGVVQFRVQPMRNTTALGGNVPPSLSIPDGVGRQIVTLPPNTLLTLSATAFLADRINANGIAFDHQGNLLIADMVRGAIWKAEFHPDGSLKSPTNCDTTFAADTLCLSNILVAHPWLESIDGIALDSAGNIWGTDLARNAVVLVTHNGSVHEIFRNPVNANQLRNSADTSDGNKKILESPSSPFLLGDRLCITNLDTNARDNSPNTEGEITPAGPSRGKISCMDQDLMIPGLPLPL